MANRGFKRGIRPFGFGVIAYALIIIGINGVVATEEACEVCACDSVRLIVDCSNKRLTELPTGIPNDTSKLDLGANFLREIPKDWLLQFYQLVSLNVTSNLISKPFSVPSSLFVLFANDNQLQDIRPMMKTGNKLERVDFEKNKLEVIRTDTFKDCRNLLLVSLNENKISKIKPGGLALSENTILSLKGNRVEELSPDMFGGRRLKELHISGNNLARIEIHTLGVIRYTAMLQNNNLQELPAGLFLDPTESERMLGDITLSDNPIRKVSPLAFKGLYQVNHLLWATSRLNDETLPKDLFVNFTIIQVIDLSSNHLTKFPGELLRAQDKLLHLYLQRNRITALDETMFKGLHSLVALFIYQNPIMQLADFQFYETSLRYLVMFQGNLSELGSRPFATRGDTLIQILLHENPIERIKDTIWQDLGPDCYVSIDKSLRQVPHMNRTDLIVELVGDDFIRPFVMVVLQGNVLAATGLACREVSHILNELQVECTPCRQGTYETNVGCIPCPPGGFYQSKTGQYAENGMMNCQICNNGTYVSLEAHPGTKATDCKVCPTGTVKSTAAGFRACPCVDNYYRTDRFGECHQCPYEGINCSGEYQHLLPGYWWRWEWGSENVSNYESYLHFVTNIRIETDSYDRNTQRFGGKLPHVHKCPRNTTCVNGGNEINTTCSDGYDGWLCSQCTKEYYSWFGHCIKCPDELLFVAEVVCIFVVVCIIVSFFVWDAYRRQRRNARNIVSVFLARGKILVGFYQVMGEIFSALDEIPWPETLQDLGSFFKILEVNILGWLISPRCFVPDFTYPNIYIEFLVGHSFVIAVVVVAFCYYGFRKWYLVTAQGSPVRHYRDDLYKSKQRCFLFVVILLFLSYPSLCSVIITLLPTGCKLFYLDEDEELNVTKLRYDYAIDCNTDQHAHFNYAAETAMVYVVGFPVALFLLLWFSKRRLNAKEDGTPALSLDSDQVMPAISRDMIGDNNDHVSESEATVSHASSDPSEPDTRISWQSFLCENYKAQFWYWEIIELSRKILQTFFILLFGPEDHFTLFTSVVLSVFFLFIHAYLKPMKDAAEQRLQMCSLGTIFLNMLAASLLLMPNDIGPLGEEKKEVLAVTLVLLNLSIIVFVGLSSIWTGIKALWRRGCFACMINSMAQMFRWCRRRYRRNTDGHAYLDNGHNSLLTHIEGHEEINEDQDARSVVSVSSGTVSF